MRITDHSFLVASFNDDVEKIRQYLHDENIVEVKVNDHTKVNTANYLANFQTYNNISHEQPN